MTNRGIYSCTESEQWAKTWFFKQMWWTLRAPFYNTVRSLLLRYAFRYFSLSRSSTIHTVLGSCSPPSHWPASLHLASHHAMLISHTCSWMNEGWRSDLGWLGYHDGRGSKLGWTLLFCCVSDWSLLTGTSVDGWLLWKSRMTRRGFQRH